MKKLLQLSFSLFFLMLFMTACEEEIPEPNEWRVLEWTVDGERHKASCERQGLLGCTALDVNYNLENGSFSIGGSKVIDDYKEFVYIYIYRGLKLEEYIEFELHDNMGYSKTRNVGGCDIYKAKTENNRQLYISEIDSTNRVIEGYYEFEGINDCQDTIKIKDGYFKVSF